MFRYHKNKKEQKPGWNREIIDWCYQEAKGRKLMECDFWGGLVIDEMKIEASYKNCSTWQLQWCKLLLMLVPSDNN